MLQLLDASFACCHTAYRKQDARRLWEYGSAACTVSRPHARFVVQYYRLVSRCEVIDSVKP